MPVCVCNCLTFSLRTDTTIQNAPQISVLSKFKEFVKQLNGVELGTGVLKLWIERTNDGEDYKLMAQRLPSKKIKYRLDMKPVIPKKQAKAIAKYIIENLTKHPKGGTPKPGVIEFYCEMYPTELI